MRYIVILMMFVTGLNAQLIPIDYLRADTTDNLIIMTKNGVQVYVSTDSLPGVTAQDLSADSDSLYISGGQAIALTEIAQLVNYFAISAHQLGISLSRDGVPIVSVDLTPYLDADGVTSNGTHNQVARQLQFSVTGAPDFNVDISAIPEYSDLTMTIDSTGNRVFSLTNGMNTVTWKDSIGSGGGGPGIDTLVNYDALRSYAGSSNVVYIQDFIVNYGGRDYTTLGGLFVKGGSGENGATIIDGWNRVFDGLNWMPDWFEMNGYDETGTDNGIVQDNDRTNGAIILCNSAGGGVVHETPGMKLIGEGGNDGGVRYGVQMLDSVELNMHGCTYYLKDALVDGSWSIGIIYAKGKKKITIRNGYIHGNALNQTFTTYEQNGKVQGIRMNASQADRTEDVLIENIQIDYVLGNPLNLYASSNTYANDYQDFTVRNLRCFHYGEGPQFLNVNNLLVDQVFLDPDTPAVGDHFELVRCDGWIISNGRIIGGSGSGSGIDLYGNQNGTVQNWHITNTKDIIEIHKDSYSNYCQNIFINNLRGENRLETTPAAITFNNGQKETRNIHFKGLYLKDYYQGISFSGADSIPGPIIIEDFVIDSMSNEGIAITHVKDLRLINGEIKRCGARGLFWNTFGDPTAEIGRTSLRVENVHIHHNGNYGISLDLQNPAKTYWCDINIDADVEDNDPVLQIQIARAVTDTHKITVNNRENIYRPTAHSESVWGRTDIFAFNTIDQLSGEDWQRIRIHGKPGGVSVSSLLGDNRLSFLDSSATVTLQADEWMDLQYNVDSLKWYETDRKNKTEIVDVHGKFVPSTEWPGLSTDRVLFWSGGNIQSDDDFTYIDDELGFKRAFIQDSLKFGSTSTRCLIRYSGNYLYYQSLISNAGHLFRDHLNQTIMQLDNSNRGVQFFGPVTLRNELRDNSLSAGVSGYVPVSNGSGWLWSAADLTDNQTLSILGSDLTISGGNTVSLAGIGGGGGSGTVKGTGVLNRVAYWASTDSLTSSGDFSFDGTNLSVTGSILFDGRSSNASYNILGNKDMALYDGSNYFWANNSGALTLRNSGATYEMNNSSGIVSFDFVGVDVMDFEGDADVRIYNDLDVDGHLGLDGKNPNGSYSIYAGGSAILEGTGSSWTYFQNNGWAQFRKNSQYMTMLVDGSDFAFQHQGINTFRFESDNDVRVFDDLYVDGRFSINTTPTGYNLRIRTEGDSANTSGIYIDDSGGSKLFELRNDGGFLGESKNWIAPLVAGVAPNSYGYGDFHADPAENNALARATDKFTVTATGTSTTNYYYWFDNSYAINGCNVLANDTAVVSIDLTSKGALPVNGLTYTQGKIVVVTWVNHDLAVNSSGRWKDKDGVWNSMTYNGCVFDNGHTTNFGSSFELYEYEIAGDNYMTDIELSLVNNNAFDLRVLAIMWFPYRAEGQLEPTSFQKYQDQNTTRALIFRNDDYDQELLIDPQSSTVMTATGQVRFNNNVLDADGDSGNAWDVFGKSSTQINETNWGPWHNYFTFLKMDNTSTSVNLNQVSWTDVSDIDTEAMEYGDSTVFSINSGDLRVETAAVVELQAVLQLTSIDTANIDIAFFKNGSAITGGMTYSVHFVGATTCTVTMNETVLASADDDFDIRARRRGSATGSVTITATESAYLQAELKHRGN